MRASTGLVSSDTAHALVRALQAIWDDFDYRIPPERNDLEIDPGDYVLRGWLNGNDGDSRFNGADRFCTVRHKLPNETLVLGDKIASALNLHRSLDTPGRWKAHHLAELVLAVRDAKGPEKVAAEARLANLLRNFSLPSRGQFRYSEGYDLKKVAPILDQILGKDRWLPSVAKPQIGSPLLA